MVRVAVVDCRWGGRNCHSAPCDYMFKTLLDSGMYVLYTFSCLTVSLLFLLFLKYRVNWPKITARCFPFALLGFSRTFKVLNACNDFLSQSTTTPFISSPMSQLFSKCTWQWIPFLLELVTSLVLCRRALGKCPLDTLVSSPHMACLKENSLHKHLKIMFRFSHAFH